MTRVNKEETNMHEVTIKVWQSWRDHEGETVEEPGYEPDCIVEATYDASDDRGEYLDWILDLMAEYPDSCTLNGPEYPRWYCYEHEGFRENYERGWTRETYVVVEGLDPMDWIMLRDCGRPEHGFDDWSLLRANCFQPYKTGPDASAPIAVFTYDLQECDRWGKSRLAYQVYHGKRLVIQGDDFACSPLDAVDSPETVRALWSFVAVATEDAYLAAAFEADCPGAAAWIESHAELIDAIAHNEMEAEHGE